MTSPVFIFYCCNIVILLNIVSALNYIYLGRYANFDTSMTTIFQVKSQAINLN